MLGKLDRGSEAGVNQDAAGGIVRQVQCARKQIANRGAEYRCRLSVSVSRRTAWRPVARPDAALPLKAPATDRAFVQSRRRELTTSSMWLCVQRNPDIEHDPRSSRPGQVCQGSDGVIADGVSASKMPDRRPSRPRAAGCRPHPARSRPAPATLRRCSRLRGRDAPR